MKKDPFCFTSRSKEGLPDEVKEIFGTLKTPKEKHDISDLSWPNIRVRGRKSDSSDIPDGKK